MPKRPIDIDEMMRRLERAVEPYPKAALFELAEEGRDGPFEQLVACILSIRTRDEVMLPLARSFLERADSPAAVAALSVEEIDDRIGRSAFHERKARQIHAIAETVVDEHDGTLPCDREVLLSFRGVGPKCANLVMGIACGEPRIGVDAHVHRITNRWGYVEASSPEKTMRALEDKLPERYWLTINRLLVPFGKNVCRPRRPRCSTCPVLEMCRQVGVEEHG